MKFQIKKIILWPNDPKTPPRTLDFKTEKVNVITGPSKTGKSAIIPIINYCLGAQKCSIPVGEIRTRCAWFGIIIKTDEKQEILLARKEPGNQQSTSEMYFQAAESIEVPQSIEKKNITSDEVKRKLSEMAGLTDLGFSTNPDEGFKGRPSFNDLLAFVFQPQNIVANSNVLFFRADTLEHRQKLITVFPYALGAINPEAMVAMWELDLVQKQLRRLEKELEQKKKVAEKWKSELRELLLKAANFGLLEKLPDENISTDEALRKLESIRQHNSIKALPSIEAIESINGERSRLLSKMNALEFDFRKLSRRLGELRDLRHNVEEYKDALGTQIERLSLSEWLLEKADFNTECPVCGNDGNEIKKELECLGEHLAKIEEEADYLNPDPDVFDKDYIELKRQTQETWEDLKNTRSQLWALASTNKSAKAHTSEISMIDRYLGGLDKVLETFHELEEENELSKELRRLRGQEKELKQKYSKENVEENQQRALKRVQHFIAKLLPTLEAESPEDPVELVIKELTIKVTGKNRDDYLWEIGSGANWLSYHVATTLGLQMFFHEKPNNPVPGLLVYDQPSQVYFPTLKADEKLEDIGTENELNAVRKFYQAFGRAVEKTAMQIIVVDHTREEVWGGIDYLEGAVDWWNGEKLVPEDWPKKEVLDAAN